MPKTATPNRPVTRTLKKGTGDRAGTATCTCPFCQATVTLSTETLGGVAPGCTHFRRAWRVSADNRIRAEFRPGRAEVVHAA